MATHAPINLARLVKAEGHTYGVVRIGRLNTRIVTRSGKTRLIPTKGIKVLA